VGGFSSQTERGEEIWPMLCLAGWLVMVNDVTESK
jgi:hypothetical protein